MQIQNICGHVDADERKGDFQMAYSTRDFRGEAHIGVRFKGGDPDFMMNFFQGSIPQRLNEQGIPAKVSFGTVKSGGLFGTKLPIMVISHPNPPSRFFDIGVVVNGNTVTFPLLGESKQNTARNLKKRYDQFVLEQEESWQASIADIIAEAIEDISV